MPVSYIRYSKELSEEAKKKFDSRVSKFNAAIKMGIDLGDKTGFALVKDNKIITAKTLIDLHSNTLENRRSIRRGRRSRQARKRRLAILRSWILRQKVDGKQLPDPYTVMRDKRYWSVYNKFKVKPETGWLDAMKNESKISPEDFVRGLTLIFRKRGYKSAKDMSKLSDKEFERYLKNTKPPIGDEQYVDIKEEILERAKDNALEDSTQKRWLKDLDLIKEQSKDYELENRESRKKQNICL